MSWLDEFYGAIVPVVKGGAYQNFIDPSLTDFKRAYHGINLERLEAIKHRVDPSNVFAFPDGV